MGTYTLANPADISIGLSRPLFYINGDAKLFPKSPKGEFMMYIISFVVFECYLVVLSEASFDLKFVIKARIPYLNYII